MNREAERQSMVRYTIMPDYGGAYGWINRNGPEDALGPNHADTCGWSGDHPISDELQANFAAWQMEFESGTWEQKGRSIFDWPRFHEIGMALTRRLKAELGDTARIYYEKPMEDPNRRIQERVELLSDGSIIECFPQRLSSEEKA